MKIPVTCTRCGKRYEVDAAFAGKTGKCANCGERMLISDNDHAASPPPSELEAYQLDVVDENEPSNSSIYAKRSDALEDRPPRREAKKKSFRRSGQKRSHSRGSNPYIRSPRTMIGMVCIVLILVIIAFIFPGARLNVGRLIALSGLILFFYGYGSGAYIAFTEDDLYGWLYLLLPPFAAYYFVSRWEEMISRLIMIIVGLALLAGGGRLLEKENPPDVAEKAALAAARTPRGNTG